MSTSSVAAVATLAIVCAHQAALNALAELG